MKVVNKIVSYLLVFILMITLSVSMYLAILNKTILNEEYVISKLGEVNYYDDLYEEVNEDFSDYILQSGLDKTVLDNIITKDMIKEDVNKIIHKIYIGEKIDVNTDNVKKNLDQNINYYLNSNNIKVSNSEKSNIEKFETTIANVYSEQVGYSKYTKYIDKAIIYVPKVQKISSTCMAGIFIADIFIIIMLVIANKKKLSNVFNYAAIVLIGSAAMLILPKIYISSKLSIDTLQILNKSFSNLVTNILSNILNIYMYLGILMLILGIIISIGYGIKNGSKYEK